MNNNLLSYKAPALNENLSKALYNKTVYKKRCKKGCWLALPAGGVG